MMKKKKTIKIKNPKLQKIRNNFRELFIRTAVARIQHYLKEKDKILRDESGIPKKLNELENKQFRELNDSEYEIERILRNSICKCATCSATDKDMTYSPGMKAWFCTECYQLNQQFYKHSHPELYP